MKIMVGQQIIEHFKNDDADTAKYYVGGEKAKWFKKFDVICVVDLEETAIMHQVIVCEFGPEAPYSDMQENELEALFDPDVIVGIKAVGVDYENQRFVVSLTHSY